jgi:ATP-dependent Clp endopeptidase proteolytic subunit ClpP
VTKHIFVYGFIGTEVGEVSINAVKAQLDAEASDYVLHIISGGGNVFEGYGIYNILKNTGKPIVTHVEGLCASIATLVAAAGKTIIMNRTSEFMIHNPKVEINGDANQLRSGAEQLDKIKNVLIDVYARRTSLGKEKLWELYDNETWLTAQEAQKMGFVDDVQDAIKAVAKIDLKQLPMKKESLVQRIIKAFRNATEYALADGRFIVCEGELAAGERVTLADGGPLEAGTHALAQGGSITTDESGTITQVEAPAAPDDKNQKTEEMDNKIKELEAALAEAKAARESERSGAEAKLKTESERAISAEAKASKFENKVTDLEKQFLALKEEMAKTVGDTTPPPAGPTNKLDTTERPYDPMAEDYGTAWVTSRPNSNYKKKQ